MRKNKLLTLLLIINSIGLTTPVNAQSLREQAEQQDKVRREVAQAAQQAQAQEQQREAIIKKNGLVLGCESVIGYGFYIFYEGIVYTATAGGGRSRSYKDASLGIKPSNYSRTGNVIIWESIGGINDYKYEASLDNMTIYSKPSRGTSIQAQKCQLIQRGK